MKKDSSTAYDVLCEIGRYTSMTKKAEIIKENEWVMPIVSAALDPHRRFHVTSKSVKTITASGRYNFREAGVGTLLTKLQARELSGDAAVAAVQNAYRQLDSNSQQLLTMILDKRLAVGAGAKTFNKVFPKSVPTHEVMRAQRIDFSRIKYPCAAEPKIDCIRGTYIGGHILSRSGKPLPAVQHIADAMHKAGITTKFDGELHVPGYTFQKASGLIRSNKPCLNAKFTVFAAVGLTYEAFLDEMRHHGLSIEQRIDCIDLMPRYIVQSEVDLISHYHSFLDDGYEGAVVKPLNDYYECKYSYQWMKMKPLHDEDVKILGVAEGKGHFKGNLGALIVDFRGKENRVSGFTDRQRKDIWDNPEKYIGKYANVEYMELTDEGNMRHAQFKTLRWDK